MYREREIESVPDGHDWICSGGGGLRAASCCSIAVIKRDMAGEVKTQKPYFLLRSLYIYFGEDGLVF